MKTERVISQIRACPFDKVLNDKCYSYIKKEYACIRTDRSYFKPLRNISKMMFYIIIVMMALFLSAFTAKYGKNNVVIGRESKGYSGLAGPAPILGTASTFGVIATTANSKTGATHVYGDVSLDSDSSATGFPREQITGGAIHINDAISAQAKIDLIIAYNDLASRPAATGAFAFTSNQDLSGLILIPGIYTSPSKIGLSNVMGPLTLDAQDNTNAVWVFQIGSSMTTTNGNIVLANGAQAKNVFWQVTQDATLGKNTIFSGTIVSGRDITLMTGASVAGRILAGATTYGTIALQNNIITVPPQ
ncbi:MAG: ice-binding family protein [Spirochaetota bacterium]